MDIFINVSGITLHLDGADSYWTIFTHPNPQWLIICPSTEPQGPVHIPNLVQQQKSSPQQQPVQYQPPTHYQPPTLYQQPGGYQIGKIFQVIHTTLWLANHITLFLHNFFLVIWVYKHSNTFSVSTKAS